MILNAQYVREKKLHKLTASKWADFDKTIHYNNCLCWKKLFNNKNNNCDNTSIIIMTIIGIILQ